MKKEEPQNSNFIHVQSRVESIHDENATAATINIFGNNSNFVIIKYEIFGTILHRMKHIERNVHI